ncbi:tetratricopeptide repeat protein [Catalinimonas alkaloidigena]|uniref:tetratricopeptide repeat protein n=1 Tax=Catalinimonas alkaloidigena TaxID=1075417 RepID=UPI0015A38259|nr:tetratricopeptide repeat protein [Catalinimonas alkaloidigena]
MRQHNRWFYGLSLAIGLLLLGTLGYFFLINPVSRTELFDQYYDPYPNIVATHNDDSLAQALQWYTDQQYPKAVTYLKQMVKRAPENDTLQFYLGSTYLAAGQLSKASDTFQAALLTSGSEFVDPMRWYLALAYLGQEQWPEAQRTLESLTQYNNLYSKQAKELLDAL